MFRAMIVNCQSCGILNSPQTHTCMHKMYYQHTHTHTHTHTLSLSLFLPLFLSFSLALSFYLFLSCLTYLLAPVRFTAAVDHRHVKGNGLASPMPSVMIPSAAPFPCLSSPIALGPTQLARGGQALSTDSAHHFTQVLSCLRITPGLWSSASVQVMQSPNFRWPQA